ncbi:MAG TPA: DUF1552 domain-containing protein [Polyangiaceae bacterium]|nr:DUF1552 domain-containing protein [Polyangiaceae bacterium]
MSLSPSRRTFLRAVGAGFATLPFYRLVENSFAQSVGEALPLKFIGVYHPHGIAAELFTMRASDTETNFNLKYENSPLAPFDDAATYGASFKSKIVVIEGIDLLSNANGHDTAGTILTGSRIDGGQKPQNSSLDQFLAVEKGLGKNTRVTSIALAVGNKELKAGETLSFGPGGAPISKVIDPVAAYDLLFKGAVTSTDPAAQAAAERQRKLGQSLVDYVNGDVKRLRARLAPNEQQKLDQHLDSLRELEKQFAAPTSGSGGSGSCSPLARPNAFPKLERYNGGEPYFDAITDAHVDILAQAMACDITRFGTLVLNDLSYANNPLGLPEDNHGGVAHTYSSSAIGSSGNPVGAGNPSTWATLAKFNRYSYSKVARLMQKLNQLGVLDSTLIYASSDMGNPAGHSTRNAPTLLAGGANGKIRMGRRLKYRTDCPMETWCDMNGPDYQTVPNNRLLVSIAQAFGVQIESYGTQPDTKLTTGKLAEL